MRLAGRVDLRTMPFVQVRVLGPVELVDGDRVIAIGSAKERSLLALLAAAGRRVMSVERLADELWAGEPPERAVEALRVYVSHLRKVLPDGTVKTAVGWIDPPFPGT